MNGRQWMEFMESYFPKDVSESWDNVGLLCGNPDGEIQSVYIALDATMEVINDAGALGADILLTHHPLLFSPLKRIESDDFIGGRIIKLIENHILYYAMHTNYDVKRMAGLAEERLEFTDAIVLEPIGENASEGIGRTGNLKSAMTLKDCAVFVKEKFNIPSVRIFGNPDMLVKRAAVCPGSGKGMEDIALRQGAEVFITGDFGHHDGIDAVEKGLAIIDAGHYGLEHIFIDDMKKFIEEKCPDIKCYTAGRKFPFITL